MHKQLGCFSRMTSSTTNSSISSSPSQGPCSASGVPYSKLTVGVPKEIFHTERRVALTPANARLLTKEGFRVIVEDNAGHNAKFLNSDYIDNGATIANTAGTLGAADIVLKVRPPMENKGLCKHEVDMLKEGSTLISFFWPAQNKDLIERMVLKKKGFNVLAMDAIPRISRAQAFDALSSMANIAGYKAVGTTATLLTLSAPEHFYWKNIFNLPHPTRPPHYF